MSRRRLSDDERDLWRGVTRSIKPLRKSIEATADEPVPPAPPSPRRKAAAAPAPITSAASAERPPKPSPPPLAPLDRRVKKRVARGAQALDGRLDLHGLTQAQAHDALFGFLRQTQAHGGRLVLVITGKGGELFGERGVLKRQVPLWLRLPEFRALIVGFESAGRGHGGEGALYVRMRRRRDA